MAMSETPELVIKTKCVTKKRRKTRKKQREDIGERDKIAAQLRERYGKSRNREDEVSMAHIDADTLEIVNPSVYERQIARATDAHLNRLLQPEQPENFVAGAYLCALCQNPTCFGSLGELFGPYYVPLLEIKVAPPKCILSSFQKSKIYNNNEENDAPPETDLWFHGYCALWAPALLLLGGHFPALGKAISKYWKQKCKVCHKVGATVAPHLNVPHPEYMHYHCAIDQGCRLNESLLKCELPKC